MSFAVLTYLTLFILLHNIMLTVFC